MWRLSQLRRSVTAVREDDVTLVETLAAEERCNFEIDDSLISNGWKSGNGQATAGYYSQEKRERAEIKR